jgi:type I restriction enzyme S subunit
MARSSWNRTSLGDLVDVVHGWPFKSEFFVEPADGHPIVVNIGNFRYTGGFRFESTTVKGYTGNFPPDYVLKPGDVLLVMTCQTAGGEILGIPGKIPDDGRAYLHNQRMGKVVVTAPSSVDPGFLYWLFVSPDFNRHLATTASGTKILHTSPGRIKEYSFFLPPLEEQREIASLLGALEDKIELNRRMNETLEAMARALFKSWFVDFDPVRAKMEGRQAVGMDDGTAGLFRAGLEDSGVGSIPVGWRLGTLGEIAANPRRTLDPMEVPPDTPYIGLEHMPRRSLALTSWGRASDVGSTKSRFLEGEILFGKLRPYFHKVGVAPLAGVCSTDVVVIAPSDPAWYGLMLGHVSSDEFVAYTDAGSTGTKMPRTSWSEMARFEILVPDARVAQVFTSLVAPLIQAIRSHIFQSRTLASIRDILLPKLLSGEIRVREAEAMVEAAS